jgi:CysZ protein
MIAFFSLAVVQLFDKSLQKILWMSLVASAILFLVFWLLVGYTLLQTELFSTGWFYGIFDWIFIKITNIFGGILIFILTWFLFPSIVTLLVTFFLEKTINSVEKKHYPNLPETRQQNMLEISKITLKFMVLSIILNVLVIPLYLVFFFLGPLNLFIFYILNGYLLGKEYFELVAYRRLEPSEADDLFKRYHGNVFRVGLISALLMTVPLINMVAPIISVAAMVHLVQKYNSINTLET